MRHFEDVAIGSLRIYGLAGRSEGRECPHTGVRANVEDMMDAFEESSPNSIAADGSGTQVKPIVNANSILRYLSSLNQPATVTQISRMLNINPSTCFNILRTLVSLELLSLDQARKTYSLGSALVELSEVVLQRFGDSEIVRVPLELIARKYLVTSSLWRLTENDRIVLVASAVPENDLHISLRVGQRLPSWSGAAGRLAAAFSNVSTREIAKQFQKIKWQNRPDYDDFLRQSREAREKGYAVDAGNLLLGVTSISVPVIRANGEIQFVLSVTMFSGQHSSEQLDVMGSHLIGVAAALKRA